MTQERMNELTLMNIEHDILRQSNFDDVINDLANDNARKVPGLLLTLRDSASACVIFSHLFSSNLKIIHMEQGASTHLTPALKQFELLEFSKAILKEIQSLDTKGSRLTLASLETKTNLRHL